MSEVNIDDLSLKISANADAADQALDRLASSIENLGAKLGANSGGFDAFLNGLANVRRHIDELYNDLTHREFKLNLKADGAFAVNELKEAIENIGKTIDGTQIADQISKQFYINDAEVKKRLKAQIETILQDAVQSYNGKTMDFSQATSDAMGQILKTVTANGKVIRDELTGSIVEAQKEYQELARYVSKFKIRLTDDIGEELKSAFGDFNKQFPGMIAKSGAIDDRSFGDMAKMFPGILSGLNTVHTKAEGIIEILNGIKAARERIQKIDISDLGKADTQAFQQNLLYSLRTGIAGSVRELGKAIDAEVSANVGKIRINLEINEEKVVADIQKALRRAATVVTEPISVNLKVNTQFLRDQIKSNLGGIDVGQLPELSSALMRLSSIDSSNILKLGQAFSSFGGKSATRSVANMKEFGAGLSNLATEVAKFTALELDVTPLSNLATAIGTLGRKSVAQATANIPQLAGGLRQLMLVMSNAPEISENTIRFVQALSTLPRTARLVNKETAPTPSRLSGIGLGAKNAISGLRKFASHLKSTRSITAKLSVSLKSLLRQMLPIMGIRQLFNWGKNAVETASALTEVQNVVDVTFQNVSSKVQDMANTSIEDFGMSELTVKKIAGRFQSMSVALGIVPSQVQKVSDALEDSRFVYGATEQDVADMSLAVTKLAGDLASFHNAEATEAAEALNAIWTGQTRPLRRFGVDLTQATLAEYALSKGMDINIKTMSQAEKTMLRYQYVMDRLGYVQGDFLATSGRSKRAA